MISELPKTKSKNDSIVFITMHKAGSVFVNSVMQILAAENGLTNVDFAGEAFSQGLKEWDYCTSRSHLFKTPGYYFGAFRGPYINKFSDLGNSRQMVQVRDPRDCIVSLYFSYQTSHAPPGEGPLKKIFDRLRNATRESEINDFAIAQAKTYKKRLDMISNHIEAYSDNCLLVTYEDMVTNFDDWLQSILNRYDFKMSQSAHKRILKLANFDVGNEDVQKHKRQVTPGDHKRKLKPETIDEMNEILRFSMERFGYLS